MSSTVCVLGKSRERIKDHAGGGRDRQKERKREREREEGSEIVMKRVDVECPPPLPSRDARC